MSSPDLEHFAGRPFSFYPPILNIEQNEWIFKEATWSEMLVHNPGSGQEIWIPRRYIGKLSKVEDPVMIVGLRQELECRGGLVMPHRDRVIAMPGVGPPIPAPDPKPESPPPPPPRRGGSAAERKIEVLIGGTLLVAVLLSFLAVMLTRNQQSGGRVSYQAVLQADLELTAQDDYFAVVRKLGQPAGERWKSKTGERQYQALDYPKRGITVILLGADRKHLLYIGAKDKNWRTVHSVKLPDGRSTDSILRSLPRF